MDKSSRNIVQFIAALTGAILLLMAAWYYQKAKDAPPAAPKVEAKAAEKPTPQDKAAGQPQPTASSTFEDEDVESIDGAPVNEAGPLSSPDQ